MGLFVQNGGDDGNQFIFLSEKVNSTPLKECHSRHSLYDYRPNCIRPVI